MTDFIFRSQFSYRQHYILRRCSRPQWVDLNGECDVTIIEVEPATAPVAYNLSTIGPDQPRGAQEIRAFAGSLWWPLLGENGPLQASDFRTMVKDNWTVASAILDPRHRTYRSHGITFDEFFKSIVVRDKCFHSTWEQQYASAQRDASRVIFCQDRVLVEAGEPVWYVVPGGSSCDRDLVVGPTSLDRCETAGYRTAGPRRHVRLASALRGLAFGLAEIEGVRDADNQLQVKSQIAAMLNRPAKPAADLCARALAEHLWNIAWLHPNLRKVLPALAVACHSDPAPEMLPYSVGA
jgi:hypothetical protein